MTLRDRDVTLVARGSLMYGLLVYVLMVLGGCSGTAAQAPPVNPVGTPPSDKTEAQLLADLDKKFENAQAHYDLARVYHKSQNWNKAEYHYNVSLGFNPANRAAQAGIVKMFADRGDKAKAEQQANGYIRQAGISVTETLRLGWEFEQLGMDAYALRCYRQAIAAAPDSDAANKQIGLYYLGKGDSANAKQYLMRSIELNPRQPDVAGALGRLGVVVQTPGIPQGPLEEKKK
jgi:tetratricopeptide (TPR) repeat protein